MFRGITLRRSLPVVGIIAGVLLLALGFYWTVNFAANYSYTTKGAMISTPMIDELTSKPATKIVHTAALPGRLIIDKIKVNAHVEHIGMIPTGAMDVPKGATSTGWFNLGPRPGEKGSSVIAGHYGTIKGKPAVFNNLSKLKKGDTIRVEDENGEMITFVVRESKSYGKGDDASAVFNSSDGKAHLNLITCEGVWNAAAKSFSKRFVVFTDRVI